MSPEKQRIAIATACGWTDCHFPLASNVSLPFTERVLCGIPPHSTIHKPLPDYLGDLNACHEMEKRFDYEQCESFSTTLADIVQAANCEKDYAFPRAFARIHATAPQRCEAFLRTLGLWEKEANEPRTEPADVATVIPDPLADMRARAEAGDRHAQCTLGDAYAHGMEVAKDRVESDRWYAMFSAPFPLTTPEPELNPATEESSATDHFRDATKMVSGESSAPTPTQPNP